ncbi:MAG: hypothetical protein IJR58_00155 [Lachnospiraceae bacterium]|nr:hypothetical protein [Lachnospiraceae bacterium]
MDSKVRVKAIATIITAVLLILVVVYMVNERQFSRLFRRRRTSGQAEATVAVSVPTVNKDGVFGEQIGDDLKAFLNDDSFFDGAVPGGDTQAMNAAAGEIDPNNYAVMMSPKVVDRSIVISLIDESGAIVTGQGFVVELNDLHLYKDDDRDGVIYIDELATGSYKLKLQEAPGFRTQAEAVTVEVN